MNHKNNWLIAFLLAILLLALGLRLWGIQFGLPYTYHIDEPFYVSGALNLGNGTVGQQPNPPGLINILFAEYGLFYIVGRLGGLFGSLSEFESFYRSDPTIFYLLGRVTSALLGGLTVLGVYELGKRLWDRRVGLAGGALLAVAFLHVRDAHFSTPDATATFFVTLAVLAGVIAVQGKAKKAVTWLALAAGLAGLATAVKWTMWPVVLPVGLASYYVARTSDQHGAPGGRHVLRRWLGLAALAGLVFLALFSLASFEFFINPTAYFAYARLEIVAGSQGGFSIWQVDRVPGWIFYAKTLSYGIGWLMLGFAVAGFTGLAASAWRRREAALITWLVFPVIYFIYMGATRHYFARYALPLIPFLALSGGWAATWLAGRLKARSPRAAGLALVGLTLLLAIQPLIYSLRFDQLLTQTDTRTLAKQWIETNLPAGSKIALDWYYHTPLLASPNLDIPIPNSQRVYNVTEPGFMGLFSDEPAGRYRAEGFDYLIASSFLYNVPLLDPLKQQQRAQFYSALDQEYTLVKTFYPNEAETEPAFIFDEMYGPAISLWQRLRPGPVIKIYAVQPAEAP